MGKSTFAVPSKAPGPGSFPIPDKAHAKAALRLIGNASPSEKPAIKAKANRMLSKTAGKPAKVGKKK